MVQLLGQGGFADVYLGEHIHLQTQAAIKVLRLTLTPENRESFRKEAQVIARLEHPHIIRILDYGVERGLPYLVMSYAAHGAINRRYPHGTQIPLPVLIPLLKQTASALQYAHSQRLIHRDIKPENMLLNRNDEVLLSDFGIALVAQTTRHTTLDVVGTATYMAPEQLMGKPTPASDQYSLAIVAYEWLLGEPPFSGSFPEVCAQQLNAPAIDRSRIDAQLMPEPIAQVLEKALAKDPLQRFPDTQAFARAFEQAAGPFMHTKVETIGPARLRLPAQTNQLSANHSILGVSDKPSESEDLTEKTPALTPPAISRLTGRREGTFLPTPPHSNTASGQRGGQQTPPYSVNYIPVSQQNSAHPWIRGIGSIKLPPNLTPKRLLFIGGLALIIIILLINILSLGSRSTTIPNNQKTPVTTATVAATATKPAAGSVLYQANWSGGDDGWSLKDGWQHKGNGIGTTFEDTEANANVFAPFKPSSANYSVETDINFTGFGDKGKANDNKHKTGAGGNADYGVIVRFDNGQGYACGLDRNAGAYIVLLKDNQVATKLTNAGYHFNTGSHTFRVKVQGGEITFSIDGSVVAQVSDGTLTEPGEVGLRSNNAVIEVTSFKVLAL